jgi:transposase-like protein
VPRPYPPEFRRRALDLVASGRTVRDVAASLGVAESCLYGWKSREMVDRGLKPGTASNESAALGDARRRIRELEDEVKILRAAASAVEKVVPQKIGTSSSPSWSMTASRHGGRALSTPDES